MAFPDGSVETDCVNINAFCSYMKLFQFDNFQTNFQQVIRTGIYKHIFFYHKYDELMANQYFRTDFIDIFGKLCWME